MSSGVNHENLNIVMMYKGLRNLRVTQPPDYLMQEGGSILILNLVWFDISLIISGQFSLFFIWFTHTKRQSTMPPEMLSFILSSRISSLQVVDLSPSDLFSNSRFDTQLALPEPSNSATHNNLKLLFIFRLINRVGLVLRESEGKHLFVCVCGGGGAQNCMFFMSVSDFAGVCLSAFVCICFYKCMEY